MTANRRRKRTGEGSDRDKPLYIISVVSELLDIHPQTQRLYEREGFICPRWSNGNTRLFSERDVEEVRRVLHLTRDLGVNLAGVEVVLEMRRKMEKMRLEMEEQVEYLQREMKKELERHRTRSALVRVERGRTVKKRD